MQNENDVRKVPKISKSKTQGGYFCRNAQMQESSAQNVRIQHCFCIVNEEGLWDFELIIGCFTKN